MLLNVESVSPSKSGKALRVKAGADWYGAKKDSGITKGMTIEAEIEDGEYGKWIGKYKAVNGSNGSSAPQSSPPPSSSGAVGAAPIWANFVSNQVAHAIQSGHITSPEQIKIWAAAAKTAFVELM
jgi:hypothetical protein